jgi:hypothetical protein
MSYGEHATVAVIQERIRVSFFVVHEFVFVIKFRVMCVDVRDDVDVLVVAVVAVVELLPYLIDCGEILFVLGCSLDRLGEPVLPG